MSQRGTEIVCRRCQETISVEEGDCPHCGASVRNSRTLLAVAVFGVLVTGTSLFRISELWFFGVFGVAIVAVSGYLLYDRRQRIDQAAEQVQSVAEAASTDDGVGGR